MPHGGEKTGGPVGFPNINFEDTLAKLAAGPGFNTDVKSVGSDGTINLHSDTPTMQMMLEQALATQPAASPVGAGGPQVGAPQQQGGGFTDLFNQPGFISALGKLGTVISGGPNTFGGQLGQFATESAESQLFKRFLQSMLQQGGGQNPSLPSSSDLGVLGVEGLSPELQSQAFQLSQQASAQTSSIEAQRMNNILNAFQSANLGDIISKRPTLEQEVSAQERILTLKASLKSPGTNTILLSELSDGRKAPPGSKFLQTITYILL